MTIVSMNQLLHQARQGGYAIGYFESWDQHSLEAALAAAEETAAPAILGFGAAVTSQQWLDRWGVEDMAFLARRLAERAKVPAVVLFNEARTLAQIYRALDAGCTAVMLDTSDRPFEENVALTREVVEAAHARGAAVEAELGHLPEAVQPGSHGVLTDPMRAATFVDLTGVDALAVSVGNVHLVHDGSVAVDMDRLAAIGGLVDVPLVLHGGSGFPPHAVRAAIACGVAKFNVGTKLKFAFLDAARAAIPPASEVVDVHPVIGSREHADFMMAGMATMKAEIVRLIQLYGSAGKAIDVMTATEEQTYAE